MGGNTLREAKGKETPFPTTVSLVHSMDALKALTNKKMLTFTTKVRLASHSSPGLLLRIKWDSARMSINTERLMFDTLIHQSLIQPLKGIRTKGMDLAGISMMYYWFEKERSRSSVYCVIQVLQNSAMHVHAYPQTTLLKLLPLLLITLLFCFAFPLTVSLLLCLLWVSSH